MMTELEALKKRHSVRSYEKRPIEPAVVEKLQAKIAELNKEGNLKLQLLPDAGDTFNRVLSRVMGLGTAPGAIICVGPDDAGMDERVGYYGQQLVLYAQQLGLNTCWAGTFNKKKVPVSVAAGDRLVLVIAIGYGQTQGKDRKSKSYDQVVSAGADVPEWFKRGVECALLAPTAINQQKFEISYDAANDKAVFKDLGGVHSQVDLGIVRYNFEVGARQ